MCWYCCISLRGAVYFGTSVHIFVGLVLLVRWIVVSYIAALVTEKLMTDVSLLILTVLSGVYLVIFITFGCLIFAGTERQSISLLKWSATGFTILQLLLFTVVLVLYVFAPEGWSFHPFLEPDTEEMRILTIAMYFCCLVATTNYILVLLLYTHKLWSNKRCSPGSGGGGSGRSSSLTNIQISHPIPHHQIVAVPKTASSTAGNNSTMNTTTSTNTTPTTYYGQGQQQHSHGQRQHRVSRRAPTTNQGPESPGIYESLDASTVSGPQHFYPAHFYAGYSSSSRIPEGQEGIYNGNASIRSNSGSGFYYHQRPYPYPHQRYREPLLPSTTPTTASIAGSTYRGDDQHQHDAEIEAETPGQDWMGAYGHRLQVFQRGQQERNSAPMEPLSAPQYQQRGQPSY